MLLQLQFCEKRTPSMYFLWTLTFLWLSEIARKSVLLLSFYFKSSFYLQLRKK